MGKKVLSPISLTTQREFLVRGEIRLAPMARVTDWGDGFFCVEWMPVLDLKREGDPVIYLRKQEIARRSIHRDLQRLEKQLKKTPINGQKNRRTRHIKIQRDDWVLLDRLLEEWEESNA